MPYIEFSTFNVYPNHVPGNPQRILRPPLMKMSLFSNNAQVYYKHHSLATGGTGTVVNSRRKGRHT